MTVRHRGAGLAAPLTLAIAVSLAVAACASTPSGSVSTTPGPGATASLAAPGLGTPAPSGSAAEPAPSLASPVTGVVTHVDLAGLGKVTGFTLLVPGGQQVVFTMGVQENATEFPAAHLSEHLASSEPVRVFFRPEGANLVVYRLEDASAASPSAS
jgi:hypothetical protein